jgi:hypothetical protein
MSFLSTILSSRCNFAARSRTRHMPCDTWHKTTVEIVSECFERQISSSLPQVRGGTTSSPLVKIRSWPTDIVWSALYNPQIVALTSSPVHGPLLCLGPAEDGCTARRQPAEVMIRLFFSVNKPKRAFIHRSMGNGIMADAHKMPSDQRGVADAVWPTLCGRSDLGGRNGAMRGGSAVADSNRTYDGAHGGQTERSNV